MRSTILNSAVRPVVIVLLDPASDRRPRFVHIAILGRPHFFFLQAAVEAFDVTVTFRVIIGRASMRDSQPMQCFDEARRSELGSVVGSQSHTSVTAAFRQSRQHGLFDGIEGFLGSATMRQIQLADFRCSSRSHSPVTYRWPGPDFGHVRLPDLIRLGCVHASPLFLATCPQTPRVH